MTDEKRKNKGSKEVQHQGSVEPVDRELATWLAKLWGTGEGPSRLEIFQMFGQNKNLHGQLIFHEDFKPNSDLDPEQCAVLSNEIMLAAQKDCDGAERKMSYALEVIDVARSVNHLTRRIGPLRPQSKQLATMEDLENLNDDPDAPPTTAQALALKYNQEMIETVKWKDQLCAKVFGDVYMIQQKQVEQANRQTNDLMEKVLAMLAKEVDLVRSNEDALSLSEERKRKGMWDQFWLESAKDAKRTAAALLPGFFGPSKPELPANVTPTIQQIATSPRTEKALITNFLHDCEETGIDVKLFGDYVVKDDMLELASPGIFTTEQFRVLLGVRDDKLPVDAALVLLPDSGAPEALTVDQMKQALPLMTEGTGTGLMELKNLLEQRRTAQQVQATQPATEPATKEIP